MRSSSLTPAHCLDPNLMHSLPKYHQNGPSIPTATADAQTVSSVPDRLPSSSLISENRLSSALTIYLTWAIYLTSRYLLLFIHKVRVMIVLWHVEDVQRIKKTVWQGDRMSTCPYPSPQTDAPATLMYDSSVYSTELSFKLGLFA